MLQATVEALVPALGAWFTFTVTRLVSFTHGDVASTTYLKVPGGVAPGVNVPGTGWFAALSQRPVPFGLPPSTLSISKGALVLHTVMVPFTPAFGAITRVTCTTALKGPQGLSP